MRTRNEKKVEAIYEATIQLVNEIGFSDISISKIAKKASVSAATIYIYHENKEDLLFNSYMKVKEKMSDQMFQHLDANQTIKEQFDASIRKYVGFILDYPEYFLFLEQIMTSPLPQKWDSKDAINLFQPVTNMFEIGKREGIIKLVNFEVLVAYSFVPIAELVKIHLRSGMPFEKERLEAAIVMSWDAIKR